MTNRATTPQPPSQPQWVTAAGPGVENLVLDPNSLAAADTILKRIYDPALMGNAGGLPWRRTLGTCRICTAKRPLTFEHIPPQSTGNNTRARGGSSWQILMQGNGTDLPNRGWFPLQRGAGAHVLCAACNSFCGRAYVPSYTEAAQLIGQAVEAQAKPTPAGPGYPGLIDLDFQGFFLGDIARQAIAMLLASSGGGAIARLHPELPAAVLNGGTDMGRLRLGLSLAFGDSVRLSPPMAKGSEHGITVFGEVAASPFRWVLSWDEDGLVPLPDTTDVTHWLRFTPGTPSISEQLTLHVGAIVSAAPGDMRDLRTIQGQTGTPDPSAGLRT
jgi:hypothetical protein